MVWVSIVGLLIAVILLSIKLDDIENQLKRLQDRFSSAELFDGMVDPKIVHGGGSINKHLARVYRFFDLEASSRHRQVQDLERRLKIVDSDIRQRLRRLERRVHDVKS